MPWPVAEVIALRIARARAATVQILATHSAARMARVVPEAAPAHEAQRVWIGEQQPEGPLDAIISIEDALEPSPLCRERLLSTAPHVRDLIVMCEPDEPGRGVGRTMLRKIDPGISKLWCDEVPDGSGSTRMRSEVEAQQAWLVASAAAWRFRPGAEELRAGFCRRVSRMRVEQMLMSIRRVLDRFPNGFEMFTIAADELARREDADSIHRLRSELELLVEVPKGVRSRLRQLCVALGTTAEGSEPVVVKTGS